LRARSEFLVAGVRVSAAVPGVLPERIESVEMFMLQSARQRSEPVRTNFDL